MGVAVEAGCPGHHTFEPRQLKHDIEGDLACIGRNADHLRGPIVDLPVAISVAKVHPSAVQPIALKAVEGVALHVVVNAVKHPVDV